MGDAWYDCPIMAKKTTEEREDALTVEDAGTEPRVYELAFHLDPELSETDAEKAYQAIRGTQKGEVIAEGEPEKVALAYTISRSENAGRRDFDSAYFCWFAYEADGEGHEAVIDAVKAEKRVIRFLDIRTTREEAKHSAEMQQLRQAPAETPSEETVSDTELDAALEGVTA